MNSNNFLIVSRKKIIIGITIIFFTFSLLASGITQHSNSSQLKKVIVVDAGHGGIDSGTSNKGVKEKDVNLKIAKYLARYLEKGSLKVIMTRENDSLYKNSRRKDIIHRVKLANQKDADLFISIHVNSFPSPSSFGGQTFYTPNSAKSKELAKYIQEELINIQPENYRQIKPGPFYVLEKTKMPAILIEVGFLSNSEDYRRLTSKKDRKQIATAIKKGIITYLNNNLHLPPSQNDLAKSSTNNSVKKTMTDTKFQLYFAKNRQNNENLTPVTKEIPVTKIFTKSDLSLLETVAWKALQALIAGPSPQKNLFPVIPKEAKLLGIKIKNKTAYVNFSEELSTRHRGGSTGEILTITSIVKTLTQFPEIEQVQILIAGQKGKSISGHLLLNHPLNVKDLPD